MCHTLSMATRSWHKKNTGMIKSTSEDIGTMQNVQPGVRRDVVHSPQSVAEKEQENPMSDMNILTDKRMENNRPGIIVVHKSSQNGT